LEQDAPLGKGPGDREEAEDTAAAVATSAAVQPASLSKTSPPLATATEDLQVEAVSSGRAGATTTALTAGEVPQVSPSTSAFSLPENKAVMAMPFGEWPTVADTSRYQELLVVQREAERSRGLLSERMEVNYDHLLDFAEKHKEQLERRRRRAARQERLQGRPPEERPGEHSADS